jgi:hypothetical protein
MFDDACNNENVGHKTLQEYKRPDESYLIRDVIIMMSFFTKSFCPNLPKMLHALL